MLQTNWLILFVFLFFLMSLSEAHEAELVLNQTISRQTAPSVALGPGFDHRSGSLEAVSAWKHPLAGVETALFSRGHSDIFSESDSPGEKNEIKFPLWPINICLNASVRAGGAELKCGNLSAAFRSCLSDFLSFSAVCSVVSCSALRPTYAVFSTP